MYNTGTYGIGIQTENTNNNICNENVCIHNMNYTHIENNPNQGSVTLYLFIYI